jgi:hypothetical protein
MCVPDGPNRSDERPSRQPASYWYGDDDARSTSVMEAMRAYRAAEVAMRRRTQRAMDMGENSSSC